MKYFFVLLGRDRVRLSVAVAVAAVASQTSELLFETKMKRERVAKRVDCSSWKLFQQLLLVAVSEEKRIALVLRRLLSSKTVAAVAADADAVS